MGRRLPRSGVDVNENYSGNASYRKWGSSLEDGKVLSMNDYVVSLPEACAARHYLNSLDEAGARSIDHRENGVSCQLVCNSRKRIRTKG